MLTTVFNSDGSSAPSASQGGAVDAAPALRQGATEARLRAVCSMPVALCHSAVVAADLGRTIDDRTILADLAFEVPSGQFVALLGANGAGKSTLLKIIAGLMEPSRGRLDLFGTPAWGSDGVEQRCSEARRRIGLIGHTPMLYRDLTARENLVFFARLHRLPGPARRADQLLDMLALTPRAHDAVKTFSRGMVQRVAIARALLTDPELLLADEPFAGLDAPSRRVLEGILGSLHAQGKTIILTNHDIPQSLGLAQHVLVLREGRLALSEAAGSLTAESVLAEIDRGGCA